MLSACHQPDVCSSAGQILSYVNMWLLYGRRKDLLVKLHVGLWACKYMFECPILQLIKASSLLSKWNVAPALHIQAISFCCKCIKMHKMQYISRKTWCRSKSACNRWLFGSISISKWVHDFVMILYGMSRYHMICHVLDIIKFSLKHFVWMKNAHLQINFRGVMGFAY